MKKKTNQIYLPYCYNAPIYEKDKRIAQKISYNNYKHNYTLERGRESFKTFTFPPIRNHHHLPYKYFRLLNYYPCNN